MSQHNAPLPEAQNALAAAHRNAPPTILLSPLGSLRDHFAVHAPEVPDWFQPEQLPPEGLSIAQALHRQPGFNDLSQSDLDELRQSVVDEEFEIAHLPTRLAAVAAEANALHRSTWQVRFDAERTLPERRFFAWRWYYADQMLATRGGA